jgi:tol-pal system protein YbgF
MRARSAILPAPVPALLSALGTVVVAFGLAGASGDAQAIFGDDEARKAILELRSRLDNLQQDSNRRLEAVLQAQSQLEGRVGRLEQAQRGNLDQINQLEQLRQEIARLRGLLEEQANEVAQMRRQQREITGALDSRLKQFEPVPVTVDDKTVNVDQAEKRAYDAALDQFRASDFKGAASSFAAFQKQYPESPLSPLVLYWEGGARYASGDFRGAISTLRQLQQRYPESQRIPDALLITGNALADSGDRRGARDTFKLVSDRYPDTPAAGTARDRLNALK